MRRVSGLDLFGPLSNLRDFCFDVMPLVFIGLRSEPFESVSLKVRYWGYLVGHCLYKDKGDVSVLGTKIAHLYLQLIISCALYNCQGAVVTVANRKLRDVCGLFVVGMQITKVYAFRFISISHFFLFFKKLMEYFLRGAVFGWQKNIKNRLPVSPIPFVIYILH